DEKNKQDNQSATEDEDIAEGSSRTERVLRKRKFIDYTETTDTDSVIEETPKIKVTKVSSISASSDDDETEEQEEPIELDLKNIKKQLEMEPLYKWEVGNIDVTQKFRMYQRDVLNKMIKSRLTWHDYYEILAFASIMVLCWPCPYSEYFTNDEWDKITRTNPYVIKYPIIPTSTSAVLREVAIKHSMGKESFMQPPDESYLSKAAALTFNNLQNLPHQPPVKSEELHCDKLLYPYINSLFFGCLANYEVRLNRAVYGTQKRPDFSCVVDDVPILNSEIKPLGVTPLQRKKDFTKIHLRAKKAVNQQINLKGGPGEAGLLTNMGDEIDSFFMDLRFGLYCSWPFHQTVLKISHLQEKVNKLAEDFKRRKGSFTPPEQIKYMSELPDSPQLRKLLG
ncbi:19297_t:CDS:2, partial [Funneliformis geosporum]